MPLDDTGLAQAQALARHLADFPVAAIYSSPLRRAVQTAQPIAQQLGLPVQPLPGLIDINYGDWQGLSHPEVAQAYPDLYQRWLEKPHLVKFPHGESLRQVRLRGMAALKEVAARHEGQVVLLVAHQVVNKVLVCAMLGLDNSHFWHIRQDTACLNVFDYQDGVFTAVQINDTCHLHHARTWSPRRGACSVDPYASRNTHHISLEIHRSGKLVHETAVVG